MPDAIPIAADFAIHKSQKRREYLRVRLNVSDAGLVLQRHHNQSSGVLSSAVWADGFAIVEIGKTVNEGDFLPFLSFSSLGVA